MLIAFNKILRLYYFLVISMISCRIELFKIM